MTRQRDLYRAIVLSAVAMVAPPGCGGGDTPADSGPRVDAQPSTEDAGPADATAPIDAPMLADATAGEDAGPPADGGPEDAGEDAFVAIL